MMRLIPRNGRRAITNFTGTVNVTYNVVDAQSGTTAATSVFNLAAVNDIQTLTNEDDQLTIVGTEDTVYDISKNQLLEGYTDADGDTMSILGLSATNGNHR